MDQSALRYWAALNLLHPILGARRTNQLLEHFHHPQVIFEANAATWHCLGLSDLACEALAAPDWAMVDSTLLWCEQPGQGMIHLGHSLYPNL